MEYDELFEMVNYPLNIVMANNEFAEITLQEFLDHLFWRGDTQADDGDLWESDPRGDVESRGHPSIQGWDPLVKFQGYDGKQYEMKVVEAFNQNIKAGEKVWWKTKPYLSLSSPTPPKEWQYATVIEMTRKGDPDVLRIYQTYGEPHGLWEWELYEFGNPATINYLRLR